MSDKQEIDRAVERIMKAADLYAMRKRDEDEGDSGYSYDMLLDARKELLEEVKSELEAQHRAGRVQG